MKKISASLLGLFSVGMSATAAFACDLCSLSTSSSLRGVKEGTGRISIQEQFTSFGRLQTNGQKVDNTQHQHYQSSNTQLIAGFDLTERFGLQLNLPYITRRVKRINDGSIQRLTETGIGDMTILGRYEAIDIDDADYSVSMQLIGGVKLPTGNSDPLKEESEEHHHTAGLVTLHNGEDHGDEGIMGEVDDHTGHEAESGGTTHTGHDDDHSLDNAVSAIHGHDIALGSGSIDVPVGASIFARKGKLFLSGAAQYTIRSKGDHDYRYADDLMWNAGPGVFLVTSGQGTISARAVIAGERKERDFGPMGKQDDTQRQVIYGGPELIATIGDSWIIEAGADFPLDIENSGTQAVQSYRVRSGVTFRY